MACFTPKNNTYCSVVLALFLLLDVSSIIILYVLLAVALTQVLPIEIVTDVTNTRNGERGTGNREPESGNKCTAATLLRIQNGGQNKRKGSKRNNLPEGEFPPAVPPDGQYVLVKAESD